MYTTREALALDLLVLTLTVMHITSIATLLAFSCLVKRSVASCAAPESASMLILGCGSPLIVALLGIEVRHGTLEI